MPYNQQMRALDQQPSLAKLAEMLQSTRSAGNQYSVPNWVPLLGGSGVGDMFLGKSPEEIENWSYGNAPMQVPEMSRVPQFKKGRAQSLADTAMLLSGPAESTARNAAAGNVGMIIKPKGGNWVDKGSISRRLKGYSEDMPEHMQDWVDKKLGSYIRNEMGTLEDPIRRIADEWPAKQEKLLAPQLKKRDKLEDLIAKYEVEPVPAGVDNPDAWRAARLRSSQRDLEDINNEIYRIQDYNPLHYPVPDIDDYTQPTKDRRVKAGYPAEGISKSDLAKRWEYYSDQQIHPDTIGDVKKRFIESYMDEYPYLKNAPDDTVAYDFHSGITGLHRIAERLDRASNPNSMLPPELRIDPEKLSRISVPQAVEHTAKINDYLAQQQAMENLKRSRNEAVVDYKQYPDKGLSWVELKLPPKFEGDYFDLINGPEDLDKLQIIEDAAHRKARSEGLDPESDDFRFRVDELAQDMFHKQHREGMLGNALKYEGDTMNHCVGGYCGSVSSGDSRIFSLRDSKGEPHVTIETKPVEEGLYYNRLMNSLPTDEQSKLTLDAYDYNAKNPHLGYKESVIGLMKDRYGPPKEDLRQVYGKNDAPPSEKYRPMIHDFMRTHPEMGDVRNIQGGGLSHVGAYDLNTSDWDVYNPSHVKLSELGFTPGSDKFNEAKKQFGDWASPEELKSLITDQGFADGGLVGTPPTMYDPMKVDDIVASIDAPHNYAEGGSVVGDLPFNDPDQLRLYHQAMKHFDDVMENTGGSKKMGKSELRVNYNKTTKGDRDRDKDLSTLIADYGLDIGDSGLNLNAAMIKPIEAEGVYLGNLSGSVPVGEGRASLGLQGLHTKYSDGLSGYTAGYTGKVGDGNLSANYFEPADHKSEGRQVQLEYNMPFSKGGSVTSQQEDLYHRAMAHYDNLMAA
jgi:hypothetical protein